MLVVFIQDVSELTQKDSAGARNFSSPEANFKIQTCWIAAQFLAHKLVNFASLTDSFIQKYWNFDLECKRGKHKAAFRAWEVTGWGLFLESPGNFSGPKSCSTGMFKVTSRLEKLPGLSRNGP